MKQSDLIENLRMIDPTKSAKFVVNILRILRAEARRFGGMKSEELVCRLFVQTVRQRPDKLVDQFPTFALMCGDRGPGNSVPMIEFELMRPQIQPRAAVAA